MRGTDSGEASVARARAGGMESIGGEREGEPGCVEAAGAGEAWEQGNWTGEEAYRR